MKMKHILKTFLHHVFFLINHLLTLGGRCTVHYYARTNTCCFQYLVPLHNYVLYLPVNNYTVLYIYTWQWHTHTVLPTTCISSSCLSYGVCPLQINALTIYIWKCHFCNDSLSNVFPYSPSRLSLFHPIICKQTNFSLNQFLNGFAR